MGASRWQVLLHVVLPAATPDILVGLRIGMGVGWTTLVAAEMVAANAGLGQMVLNASNFLRTDVVIMGILVIGSFAVLFEVGMRWLERVLVPWKGKVVRAAADRPLIPPDAPSRRSPASIRSARIDENPSRKQRRPRSGSGEEHVPRLDQHARAPRRLGQTPRVEALRAGDPGAGRARVAPGREARQVVAAGRRRRSRRAPTGRRPRGGGGRGNGRGR